MTGPYFDVLAIAASAGGVHALERLVPGLPSSFPAAVVIVQHLDPRYRSHLSGILSRRTALPVHEAAAGDHVAPGMIVIAPPNHHLLINGDRTVSLTQSELVHFVRPSADLLFESVAASYKERALAVVLTGSGSDGAMGLSAIKKMGGKVVVQDPDDAEFPGMPQAALQTGTVDFVVPLRTMAAAFIALVNHGDWRG